MMSAWRWGVNAVEKLRPKYIESLQTMSNHCELAFRVSVASSSLTYSPCRHSSEPRSIKHMSLLTYTRYTVHIAQPK